MTKNFKVKSSFQSRGSKFDLTEMFIFFSLGLVMLGLQYWKPTWWWRDNFGANVWINILGEPTADFLFYLVLIIIWFIIPIAFYWRSKKELDEGENDNSIDN